MGRSPLERENNWQMFIYDLALELTHDAKQAFAVASGEEAQKADFLGELADAMKAIAATDQWTKEGQQNAGD